jgi:mannan endo-1,4-beta-mannosidase
VSHDRATAPPMAQPRPDHRWGGRVVLTRILVIGAVIITVAAVALVSSVHRRPAGGGPTDPVAPPSAVAPVKPRTILGVYEVGVPESYAGIRAFTATTGVRPGVVLYYSGWMERFQARFAEVAAKHGAATIVQINPTGISLAAIASGQYDSYLHSFASAVKAFGGRVILSFGHEMNGPWYPWGHQHTSPATFVAAWRHIVTVFREVGARNATWLWTVNVMHPRGNIPSPARWWPGSAYVNWVGIDGYYYRPAWTFASLFGPTIKAIRALTLDPILIAETGATPAAGKPSKIADLFAGVRDYGLLGFVWFDANRHRDWRISGPAAYAAFRRGARAYQRPALSVTGSVGSLASGPGGSLILPRPATAAVRSGQAG